MLALRWTLSVMSCPSMCACLHERVYDRQITLPLVVLWCCVLPCAAMVRVARLPTRVCRGARRRSTQPSLRSTSVLVLAGEAYR